MMATRWPLSEDTQIKVVQAEFSSDSQRIVTASWDHTARVWDTADGRLLATLQGHSGPDCHRNVLTGWRAHRHNQLGHDSAVWEVFTLEDVEKILAQPCPAHPVLNNQRIQESEIRNRAILESRLRAFPAVGKEERWIWFFIRVKGALIQDDSR
ncbi:MAG TPA: WD40 repeat domain-containing protein [Candidatus Angelobacter sp.]